jgi:hypothetical protein
MRAECKWFHIVHAHGCDHQFVVPILFRWYPGFMPNPFPMVPWVCAHCVGVRALLCCIARCGRVDALPVCRCSRGGLSLRCPVQLYAEWFDELLLAHRDSLRLRPILGRIPSPPRSNVFVCFIGRMIAQSMLATRVACLCMFATSALCGEGTHRRFQAVVGSIAATCRGLCWTASSSDGASEAHLRVPACTHVCR